MSWLSSIISGPRDDNVSTKQLQARQRAATRARLVKNLRNAAQALAALQGRQRQQSASQQAGGAMGAVESGGAPPLIGGDSPEAVAVCAALEQCLFHRIRVKEFGVLPFWAFLERVERVPLAGGASRPGPRERRLSSVRNTVGAVASLSKVSTPLGRARAWIRQCLVSKCLEACVAALLDEERLVKVFYEPTSLARCREGSAILLRLCAALEAFDVTIDTDQSAFNSQPRWPILEEEDEWDRRAEASAAAAAAARTAAAATRASAPPTAFGQSPPGGGAMRGSAAPPASTRAPLGEEEGSLSWFQQQRQRQQQEAAAGRSEVGGWAATALSEFDQLANGDWNEQLDSVITTVSSKVDQAVQSLDETINDIFGDPSGNPHNNTAGGGSISPGDGWVELRGGRPAPASALLDPEAAAAEAAAAAAAAAATSATQARSSSGNAGGIASSAGAGGGYPGAFVMGSGARRGGAKGRGRVFGVPLQELVLNPERCRRGVLDPALGVPDAVLNLIEALSEEGCRNAPGLFLREASETDLIKVVKSLDKTNRVPGGRGDSTNTSASYSSSPAWLVSRLTGGSGDGGGGGGGGGGVAEQKGGEAKGRLGGVSPHALASALVYFLHRLPEPLLTFQRREAFLACEAIPDLDARIRNVQLLVEDLPWAHQPLLLALADLFVDIGSNPSPRSTAPPRAPHAGHDSSPAAFLTEGVTVIDETEAELDVSEDVTSSSGVAIREVAETLAPAMLRYPSRSSGGGAGGVVEARRPDWEEELAATSVVELMLAEQRRVLEGMRAEHKLREKRLSRKVKRLGQLQKMLAAPVFLERPAHLAIAISIWRRLEKVEQEMLQEAAEGSDEALGFVNFSAPSTAQWQDQTAPRGGAGAAELKSLSSRGEGAAAAARALGGASRDKTPGPDEDRDVRELESMLMGLEAEEELGNNVPVMQLTADGEEEQGAGLAAAAPAGDSLAAIRADRDGEGEGEGRVLASEAGEKRARVGSHSPVAFTIEEDNDDDAKASTLGGSASVSPTASAAAAAAVAELESTRKLLGSITATLTPESAPSGGSGEVEAESGGPLPATRSELALVNLMEQAGEEPGGLSELPLRPPSDKVESTGGDGLGKLPNLQPGQSSFDDALLAGSSPPVSGGDGGDVGMHSDTSGRVSGGSGSQRPHGATPGHERAGYSGAGSSLMLEGIGHVRARTASAPGATTAAEDSRESGSSSAPRREPVFSLGHDRWVKCGFTSAHTVGREGQHEESVGRALRDASSVLALDSVNYFLTRYPRSAARAVKSCARRHILARGGGDSCPFPVHAGDITRVIVDLLSLQPPPPSSGTAEAGVGSGNTAAMSRDPKGSESEDARAFRLAVLPTWRLLDAPNAFQEAFSCAVMVMEAAQTAGARGQHRLRYEESLLEMRRVLHACILHAPSNVDAFWAAAAVEGGVSPDPRDVRESTHEAGSPGVFGRRHLALSEELVRVLGLAALDLREEDLPLLGEMTIAAGRDWAPTLGKQASLGGSSVDDRLSFRRGSSFGPANHGAVDGPEATAVSSDWLLAAETARSGMIDSVSAENSGRSGTRLVDDGVFQTRLLCASQILSDTAAQALARRLPDTVGSSDWVSLFSTARHGYSLTTLLARCAGWQPTIVVVEACSPSPRLPGRSASTTVGSGEVGGAARAAAVGGPDGSVDASGEGGGDTQSACKRGEGTTAAAAAAAAAMEGSVTFGGFASGSPWKSMGRAFAGDGGSFLFTFGAEGSSKYAREQRPFEEDEIFGGGGLAGGDASMRVYPWSRKGRCFMTSDDAVGLGMGGGGDGGNFGFLLSEDLRSGSTGRCETFQNPPLVQAVELGGGGGGSGSVAEGGGSVFDVMSVEVWGFRAAKAPEGLTRIAL